MAKKALLIGCNYPGSQAELAGCVNDVFMIKSVLTELKGFDEADIQVMIDTDENYPSPTGANIKAALDEICSAAQPGDVIVMHFSGHGTQVPSDGDDDEEDNKDEAICPTDMNLIVDDDLKSIITKIPEGCEFTFISDCCHSGSMLDHAAVQIEGEKAGGGGGKHLPEPSALLDFLGGSREVDVTEAGVKSRELQLNTLTSILSQKLGRQISSREVRGGINSLFGAQASAFVTKLTGNAALGGMVSQFLNSAGGASAADGTTATTASAGGLGGLGGMLGGATGGSTGGGLGGMLGGATGGSTGGGLGGMLGGGAPAGDSGGGLGGLLSGAAAGGGLGGMLGGLTGGAAPTATATAPAPTTTTTTATTAPTKPDTLHPDKGVLITGCQADETSADVRPPGGDAFGALTHTLCSTVRENPDDSFVNVVTKVRAKMVEKKFAQNPCLECSEMNAAKPFIC